ncbi:acetate kinase [Massilia sp. TSP1-1-2]|uniref:acetate kinase n=1 Tax=Massilia sp. TSP1-1-2 TaxID=2804649 RepID=UPI003CE7E910
MQLDAKRGTGNAALSEPSGSLADVPATAPAGVSTTTPATAADGRAVRPAAATGTTPNAGAQDSARASPDAATAPRRPAPRTGYAAVDAAAAPTAPAPTAPAPTTPAPTTPASSPVGKPPASRGRPPEVAPLFEQPGVLPPTGKFIFEPAVQFGYSSSNRVALVGYTIIPALLIGLVDVREVKRNTTTAILSGRLGLTNRLEIDAKIPYVYRSDATVSREIFTGTAVENVFGTSGKGIGDAEVGMRYQLNSGGPDSAYYVGSLRFKSRTGRDPFSVITDCVQRCIGPNASGTGLPLDLPTGSGFFSIQPGLTWLFPSDPAVFFGSVSYLHNFKRSDVSRTVLGGEREFLGEIKPGDIVGFNFGMGLGLNEKASFSLGYDHSSIGRTRQNGIVSPGAVRTQLGTLLLGFSYRINDTRSLNVAVGAGLTRDTPDVTLTVRMPTTF